MAITHVPGKDAGHVMLFALSTCVWCGKTKKLLDEMGVAYDYEYIDLLKEDAKKETMKTVKKWNPACSFPTLVIKDSHCIVGFKEDEIRKALSK